MFTRFKRQWKSMRQSRPGRRFQDRYERNQKTKKNRSVFSRLLLLGLALVSFAIGVVLVFIPGPAILFFAISGGLVAGESHWVARCLDWTELRLRSIIHWGVRHWQRLHAVGKTAVVGVAALGGGGVAYASYQMLMR